MSKNENIKESQDSAFLVGAIRRSFYCLKCKDEVIYIDDHLDIMERADERDGVFCSNECEYSFYNGGDGSDY